MFGSLAAAFNGAQAERERTPVRRQSRAAGKCEGVFWRRTSRQDVQKILLAVKRYESGGTPARITQRTAGGRSDRVGRAVRQHGGFQDGAA